MKKTGIVILNYNSHDLTIALADRLSNMKCVDCVCIVDNCSSDSFDDDNFDSKVVFIKNNQNTGYAAGNNVGLRHLVNHKGCDYVFISNPDVYFTEDTIKEACKFLDEYPSIGLISTKRYGHNNSFIHQYHKFPSFKSAFLNNFFILSKLNNVDPVDLQNHKVDAAVPYLKVDAVPGAFFGMRSSLLKEINFLYEGTFLYCEEIILGRQALELGYDAVIINTATHIHDHHIAHFSNKKMYKMDRVSLMIYFEKFNLLSPIKKLVLKFGIFVGYMEYNFAYTLYKLFKK